MVASRMGDALFAPMKFEHSDTGNIQEFVRDDVWVMEQKLDGTRCLVKCRYGITFLTHGGRQLKHTAATQHFPKIEAELLDVLQSIDPALSVYLDGEIMIETGVLWLFDATAPDDDWTLEERRDRLQDLFREDGPLYDKPHIKLAYQARTSEEKQRLVSIVEAAGSEGLMVKNVHSLYEQGKRVQHSLKIKFVKTAEVVVVERDTGGKNARLAVMVDGELVPVGSCSMIGKPDAQIGDVVEVKYLYKPEGGYLYQPRMVRIRGDKMPRECDLGQFRSYSREIYEGESK